MAEAEPHYLLKLLSGSHLGAEVRLPAGSYRVGRGEDADIVLDDRSLAEEHALLTLDAEGVRVEPLLGEVLVDGTPHRDAARRLPFFVRIGLAGTQLAIGPETAVWPALAASGTPAPVPAETPAAPLLPPAAGPDAPAAAPAALVPAGAAALAPVPALRSRTVRLLRAWPVLLILLLLFLLLARQPEPGGAPAGPALPQDPAARLAAAEPLVREALAGLPVSGLAMAPDARRERLVVEAWLPTEADRKTAQDRLDALKAIPLSPRLYSQEQVMGQVAATLQALGRPLETAWAGPGEVRLKGYLGNASDLQRAVDLLQNDVTGLKAVDNQVMTQEAALAWVEHRLAAAGLGDALRVRRGDGGLQVKGTVTPEQRLAFARIAADYGDGPGRYLGLDAQLGEAKEPAGAAPAEEAAASFVVRAASPGPPAFVVLGDGQKYLEGSRLPGGWTLEHIDGTAMTVVRDGRRQSVGF